MKSINMEMENLSEKKKLSEMKTLKALKAIERTPGGGCDVGGCWVEASGKREVVNDLLEKLAATASRENSLYCVGWGKVMKSNSLS